MTAPEPPTNGDDIFASLLAGLSENEPRGPQRPDWREPVPEPEDDPAESAPSELDAALFSDDGDAAAGPAATSAAAPAAPADIDDLTGGAADDEAARWGRSGTATAATAGAALFAADGDQEAAAQSPYLTATPEPHVPWWEKQRLLAIGGAVVVVVLVLGGLVLASQSDDPAEGELSTDTTRGDDEADEDESDEGAAVTTTVPDSTPDPTGLPTETQPPGDKPPKTTTTKKPTPTTKAPAPAPAPPPPTEPTPPPTTTPVDPNVQWGRDMEGSTAWAPWEGKLYVGNDWAAARTVRLSMKFFEQTNKLEMKIVVDVPEGAGPDPYDVLFYVSAVPDFRETTSGTSFGSLTAWTDGGRVLFGDGTKTPDVSPNAVRVSSTGPISNQYIRIAFDPEPGKGDGVVYEFTTAG